MELLAVCWGKDALEGGVGGTFRNNPGYAHTEYHPLRWYVKNKVVSCWPATYEFMLSLY